MASIEREIEGLKSFLARYPPPGSEKPAGDVQETFASESPDDRTEEETPEPTVVRLPFGQVDRRRARLLGTRRRQIVAAAALAAIIIAVALPRLAFFSEAGDDATTGTLSVSTDPVGMTVVVDGTRRGASPLTVALAPGEHVLELVTASERRRIPVRIAAGGQVSHFIELAPLAVNFANTPASAPVAAVPTAGAADSNAAGWITVAAPVDVQIHEKGRLLGSSGIDRIMLPVGRHELEFVDEALGYRSVQTVEVVAGGVVPVKLRWPQGTVSLNAIPWAEVFIDGESVGETPIGNLPVPIGVHEVVFRHPELGERRASVTVAVGKPATLGVDMGAK